MASGFYTDTFGKGTVGLNVHHLIGPARDFITSSHVLQYAYVHVPGTSQQWWPVWGTKWLELRHEGCCN